MTDKTIGDAVWTGDYWGKNGAIARARRQYEETPRIYLSEEPPEELVGRCLVYMNALYSAFGSVYPAARRGNPCALFRAVYLLGTLRPFYERFLEWKRDDPCFPDLTPDQEEMLAAQLAKFSDIPFLGGSKYRKPSRNLAESAMARAHDTDGSHTIALAALTLARLDLFGNSALVARAHLRFAEERAGQVQDPNQKARILRSCAELWNQLGMKESAMILIRHAEEVPDISHDVSHKVRETKRSIRSS